MDARHAGTLLQTLDPSDYDSPAPACKPGPRSGILAAGIFPYNGRQARDAAQLCPGREVSEIMKHASTFAGLLCAILLAGCATNVPKAIKEAPPGNPMVAEVRSDTQRFIGTHVRWGGTIATLDNQASETWVEIVARELDRSGQPRLTDRSAGRFIAVIDGFLDPALYAEGREITVSGVIEDEITRKIGDYDYTFPRVRVNDYLLWPQRLEPDPRDYPPYWYYDPWYRWYPYYYPPRYYHHPPAK